MCIYTLLVRYTNKIGEKKQSIIDFCPDSVYLFKHLLFQIETVT